MAVDRYDGDVAILITPDGGAVSYFSGQPLMDAGGLENAVIISLFTQENWHGNALDPDRPIKQIGSRFEESITGQPLTTQSLLIIEEAGAEALQWLIDINAAQEITVFATAPNRNRVNVNILIIKPDGTDVSFLYELSWAASVLRPVINSGN